MDTMTTYTDARRCHEAACAELYRSEQALHDAHQTGVDQWITAAADGLHRSVLRERSAAARVEAARVAHTGRAA